MREKRKCEPCSISINVIEVSILVFTKKFGTRGRKAHQPATRLGREATEEARASFYAVFKCFPAPPTDIFSANQSLRDFWSLQPPAPSRAPPPPLRVACHGATTTVEVTKRQASSSRGMHLSFWQKQTALHVLRLRYGTHCQTE